MAPIIRAENLTKVYHVGKVEVPALQDVSFAIEPGEFVSVVGPSGSGKSTLFYILGGLTPPTSGRVFIDGIDVAGLSDSQRTDLRKRKIGFVFQKFNLLPTLTARGNSESRPKPSTTGEGSRTVPSKTKSERRPIRQEGCYHRSGGRQHVQTASAAPSIKDAPIACVGRQRGFALAGLGEVGGKLERGGKLDRQCGPLDGDQRVHVALPNVRYRYLH